MAFPPNLLLLLLLISAISIPITTAQPPSPTPTPLKLRSQSISTVLSSLGYRQLSTISSQHLPNTTLPLTIFAPTDTSLLTCPSCSLPLLLLEHSIPSLYPISLLLSLPFGTKIQTLSPKLRCLTLTFSPGGVSGATAFINGVEITKPEVYKSDKLIVHEIRGFLSHLSHLSCNVEAVTSLSFPAYPTSFSPFFMMRLMLKDAMLRLRISGYSVLALAMREKYRDLLELRAATIFALDDESIFSKGQIYVRDLRFHIVPNRKLTADDLVTLPAKTVLPTMDPSEKLVITTGGGGGLLEPMRINYVKVTNLDLLFNGRIAVHGIVGPLRHVFHDLTAVDDFSQNERTRSVDGENVVPTIDDYH